jgi:hypothetical protein
MVLYFVHGQEDEGSDEDSDEKKKDEKKKKTNLYTGILFFSRWVFVTVQAMRGAGEGGTNKRNDERIQGGRSAHGSA